MRLTKRHIQVAAVAVSCAVILTVVGIAFVPRRAEEQPVAVPNVPPSTSRDPKLKADDVLNKLQTGMLRGDVEALLGPPSAVESIQSGNGKLSYRATFMRDRIRPPLPPLVLEFDATQSGHPLLMAKPM